MWFVAVVVVVVAVVVGMARVTLCNRHLSAKLKAVSPHTISTCVYSMRFQSSYMLANVM